MDLLIIGGLLALGLLAIVGEGMRGSQGLAARSRRIPCGGDSRGRRDSDHARTPHQNGSPR